MPDDKSFGYNFNLEQEVFKEKINELYKNAEVYFDNSNSVNVMLNLNVDEMLPDEALNIIEKIYTGVKLEDSVFNQLAFYLIDEDNMSVERARIFFTKHYSWMSGDGDGSINVSGIFKGGRLNKYRNKFEELITTNEFINKYYENYSDWELGYVSTDVDSKNIKLHVGDSPETRFHISARIGDKTPAISFEVNDYAVKKYKFISYDSFFDINDSGDQKCVLSMNSEGTGTMILNVYTDDYLTMREVMSVSAYTPTDEYKAKLKNDCNLYRCAIKETETENSDIKRTISAKDKVVICGTCENFYYVRTKDGMYGYIDSEDLDV